MVLHVKSDDTHLHILLSVLISGVVNAQIAKSLICVSEEHQAMYPTNSGK